MLPADKGFHKSERPEHAILARWLCRWRAGLRPRALVKSVLIRADASIMSMRASSPAGGGRCRRVSSVCSESAGLTSICADASSKPSSSRSGKRWNRV